MTDYLLDTNVISDVTRLAPSQRLVDWLAVQDDQRLFIASLTLAEVGRGILALPTGRKRKALEAWFLGAEGPAALFAGRIDASSPSIRERRLNGRNSWPKATGRGVPAVQSI